MKPSKLIYGAAFLILVACNRETATERAQDAATQVADATKGVVQNIQDRFDTSVPIGPGPTREEIERERFNQDWRKLQSMQAARNTAAQAPRPAPAPQPAPVAGSPAPSIQFITAATFTEKMKGTDPSRINSLPVMVPIKGDVNGPSVLKAQVLLDKTRFSGGAIDGRWGKNSEIAVYWFQRENNLEPTGEVDEATFRALAAAAGGSQAVQKYTLTAEDLAGPFAKLPEDVYEKAKLKCLCYESLSEMLAEKFHTTIDLLKELNPGANIDSLQAGGSLFTPSVRAASTKEAPDDVSKIVVSAKGSYLHGLDATGRVVFHAPTTLGSKYDPSPNETVQVKARAYDPHFKYQPKLFADVPDDEPEADLQPGPNSPVGKVWMALSKKHFGIHGTNDPDSIGYASSHGCVRLANWDALELAHRTPDGTTVEFVDTRGEKTPSQAAPTR